MTARQHGGAPSDAAAMAEYIRYLSSPAAIHASCEDYRATATVDLVGDGESAVRGDRVTAPVLARWGAEGLAGRHYGVLGVWRQYAATVTGRALPCGHYLRSRPGANHGGLLSFLAVSSYGA
jgi:haloacetate dehalogenase